MNEEQKADILAAHADELNASGRANRDAMYQAWPGQNDEITALMDVAARAKRTLPPVPMAPVFRARLGDSLMMAAHHQQAHRMLAARQTEPPWGWLIGAAALGSAAGLIAVVLRSRAQPHKPEPQPQPQSPP